MALAFPLWPGTLSQCVGPGMHCPPIVCALHDVSVESLPALQAKGCMTKSGARDQQSKCIDFITTVPLCLPTSQPAPLTLIVAH